MFCQSYFPLDFTVYNTLTIMHNILREKYLTRFLKVKKILAVCLEFWSNWLRLISLCENITLFSGSGPDYASRLVPSLRYEIKDK